MDLATAAASFGSSKEAQNLFISALKTVGGAVASPAYSATVKILSSLSAYSAYVDETHERVSMVKTFADPSAPVRLLDHFVTTELRQKPTSKGQTQDDLIERLLRGEKIVCSATAGFGKSMLMRYIALSMYEAPQGKIPIFVELRDLNRITKPDLTTFINATYKTTSRLSVDVFKRGLEIGVFCLILDGFDEVNHELRDTIEGQILKLAKDYPLTGIIVSGRPDDKFSSWRQFETLKVCPMSKVRVIELLEKLDFDRGTKKRFIAKVKKGLFETHESFLSTPLLAILMLLTYQENANIPDKMHLFYGKAFETLFHKHDALKEQYERKRRSGLAIDEFQKVFSVFCLHTYVKEQIEFTQTELIEFLRSALKYTKKDADPEKLLFDLDEAVCLLQKEGASYFFVHRSFQEYFTAVFLSACPERVRNEFINQVANRYWDNVLPMLFDMASDQLEPSWVIENIDAYLAYVGKNPKIMPLNALTAHWRGFVKFAHENGETDMSHILSGDFGTFLAILRRFYPTTNNLVPYKEMMKAFEGRNPDSVRTTKQFKFMTYNFGKNDLQALSAAKVLEYSARELRWVKSIRAGIDRQQAQRNKFLDELFNSPGETI